MAAQIQVVDAAGKSLDALTLSNDIVVKEVNPTNFSLAVRALMQSWRQGTVACKSRGEVSFSNKKPWKQKGTGRARAGRASSPIWRTGGAAFGPQERVKTHSINRHQKVTVFNNLFADKMQNKAIFCCDFDLGEGHVKTKDAYAALKNMGLDSKKVLLMVPFDDFSTAGAFRNISNVNITSFDAPNVYALSNADCWVFFKKDVSQFEEMIAQWN